MIEVQQKPCDTCPYRKGSPLDYRPLEAAVADPKMKGFFIGHRICHNSKTACCRGFWNRNKNKFTIGQLAQRFRAVMYVQHEHDLPISRDMKKLWAERGPKMEQVYYPAYLPGRCANGSELGGGTHVHAVPGVAPKDHNGYGGKHYAAASPEAVRRDGFTTSTGNRRR
ncbi:MAG: hypothetical protein AB7H77_09605 [Bdellovibrionales bacterium]